MTRFYIKLFLIITVILTTHSTVWSQNPEDVVRNYISALNEWLASPYDFDKKQRVVNILTYLNGACTMSDEIVEKYGEGRYRCLRDTYLRILSEKTKNRTIRVQIIKIKDVEYQSDKDIVTATLKYTGEISMTTDTEFWVFNNNTIGYIDKGRSNPMEVVIDTEQKIKMDYSQPAEQVVHNYVRYLNEWLASPYDTHKKELVETILQYGNEKCTMKDEIVEKYNKDAGVSKVLRDGYLSILSDLNRKRQIHIEILDTKNVTDEGLTIVTVVLKYTGGIVLTTVNDFWISGNGISYIVSNDRELLRLRNRHQNQTNQQPSVPQLIDNY